MADGTTPAATTSASTTTSAVSAADVANANALNQAVSAIRQQLAADNSSQIAILNSIASAITNSMVGGTTGTAANHVLLSKGTTGFALQPSTSLTMDGPTFNALQNSVGAAGVPNEYFRLKPTDFTTGKPYLFFKTGGAATEWQFGLWDGTNSAGQVTLFSSILQHTAPLNNNSAVYIRTTASDSHFVQILPSNSAGGWNNIVQTQDQGIIYAGGAADTGAIVFGPWSSFGGGAGFRMDNHGISTYATEAGFQEKGLTDAATVAWDMNVQQNAFLIIGGNRTMGTPTNVQAGFTYILAVQQDGTGGRTLTFPNPPFHWPGGVAPVLSTGANAFDVFSFYAHTSNFICGVLTKAFS